MVMLCIALQAVTSSGVHFYLALSVEGDDALAVAFPTLLPRLALLKPAYQSLITVLQTSNQLGVN